MTEAASEPLKPPVLEEGLPTLRGRHLSLRGLTESDLEALLEIWGDDAVMRYMARAPLESLEEARGFLEGIEEGVRTRSMFQWGVELPGGGVVGTLTLFEIDWQHRRAEIGFALARSQWRKGLMREAAEVALRYSFEELGLHRIEADVDPRNTGSVALIRSLGFVFEGRLRQRYFDRGEIQDADFYGLLAPEWRTSTISDR